MRAYIIGKVTGCENNNLEKFRKAQRIIEERESVRIDIPHEFIPDGTSWNEAMHISLCYLTSNAIKKVYVLDDFADSKGAKLELEVARAIGLEIVYLRENFEEIR